MARALSLSIAGGLALLLLAYPFVFGTQLEARDHVGLTVLLIGMCAAFVHGFGYQPDRRHWRVLFHPLAAWALMGSGLWLTLT